MPLFLAPRPKGRTRNSQLQQTRPPWAVGTAERRPRASAEVAATAQPHVFDKFLHHIGLKQLHTLHWHSAKAACRKRECKVFLHSETRTFFDFFEQCLNVSFSFPNNSLDFTRSNKCEQLGSVLSEVPHTSGGDPDKIWGETYCSTIPTLENEFLRWK